MSFPRYSVDLLNDLDDWNQLIVARLHIAAIHDARRETRVSFSNTLSCNLLRNLLGGFTAEALGYGSPGLLRQAGIKVLVDGIELVRWKAANGQQFGRFRSASPVVKPPDR